MTEPSRLSTVRPRYSWILPAAGLAVVLGVYADSTRTARLANLKLPSAFPEVHVESETGDPSRCLVADRGGVTERRSEPEQRATRWKCSWHGSSPQSLAALDGGRSSSLFVPVERVTDPAFPLAYSEVREHEGATTMPRMRWTQLFVDRLYRGLFLQVTWPGKDFVSTTDFGRAEVLFAAGDRLYCLDGKLRPVCRGYDAMIAEGSFPQPLRSPAVAALEALLPDASPRAFLLTESGDPRLRPWPLPFDLKETLGLETSYFDRRISSWKAPPAGAWKLVDADRQNLAAAIAADQRFKDRDPTELLVRLERSPTLAAGAVVGRP